jgi:Fibronectin type III domain/Viral BACON domain
MMASRKTLAEIRLSGTPRNLFVILLVLIIWLAPWMPESFAFPVAPTALSYNVSTANPTPPAQTITFSTGSNKRSRKRSLVPTTWSTSSNVPWMTISPSTGTIAGEEDQIAVQVNATGLAIGTYSGNVSIAIQDRRGRAQITPVAVTLVVSGGTTGPSPSIQLNPTNLSFSGTAGGPAPLAKPVTLSNPTGGTLTWTLTETAPWLGLNVSSGTTSSEVDSISANVSTTGLAAGTYSTAIIVEASGATNSPQTIPVTLTLSPPTITGTATLTWQANQETDLAGYNVYVGTQPGVYQAPISAGIATNYAVGNLIGGKTYYFSVTAVDTAGNESPHSSEVSKSIF